MTTSVLSWGSFAISKEHLGLHDKFCKYQEIPPFRIKIIRVQGNEANDITWILNKEYM